jgi:hypothetical protein
MRTTLARFAATAAALCLVLAVAAAAQEKAAPPAGHPMAKIHPGMVQEQVRDILGAPTSTFSYRPGQAWIPWNYAMGRDQQRYEWYYKGKGVVIFNTRFWWSGSPTVWRVDYDPNEDGYHN